MSLNWDWTVFWGFSKPMHISPSYFLVALFLNNSVRANIGFRKVTVEKEWLSRLKIKFIFSKKVTKYDEISQFFFDVTKGQIISKRLFGVLEFSQKTNKRIPCSSKNEFVCSFFGRIWGHQKVLQNYMTYSTLESGIDVGQGITVGPGKFVKKNKRRALNKRRAWTKCANLCNKKPIKLENFWRPW